MNPYRPLAGLSITYIVKELREVREFLERSEPEHSYHLHVRRRLDDLLRELLRRDREGA